MSGLFALIVSLVIAPQDSTALKGARTPAFAPDGRIAVSLDGDLYVQQSAAGRWMRLTTGPAWDRDPAWTRDGKAIVFASDRGGPFSLWRLAVDGNGAQPERLTTSHEDDSAPSIAPDGSIAFVRGFGGAARIWVRGADGGGGKPGCPHEPRAGGDRSGLLTGRHATRVRAAVRDGATAAHPYAVQRQGRRGGRRPDSRTARPVP